MNVDELIAALVATPVTGVQLRQDAPHFDGLSTAEAERVRAHLFASFETTGVPADAVAVLAEELRTSSSPVVLAGAARAVQGIAVGDDCAASSDWRALLLEAADRIELNDVFVRWQPGTVAPGWLRTARAELLAAIETAPRGAIDSESPYEGPTLIMGVAALHSIEVEDQDGERLLLDELLGGGDAVVAFFYTRCMNPRKCSLTVTRLARLAEHVARSGSGPQVLAVSYDPDFDSPHRLRRYGTERGFPFSERARIVRCTSGWQKLRSMLELRVGYGPTTVSEHAREVFRISADGIATGLDPDSLDDLEYQLTN